MRPAAGVIISITAASALAAFGAGNVGLGLLLATTAFVMVLLTYADRLPGLHVLPVVGATRPPDLIIHVEGRNDLLFLMESDGPEDVVLSVGLPPGRRTKLTDVSLNAYVVGASNFTRCSQDGTPHEPGRTPHHASSRMKGPDAPYWQEWGLTIPPAQAFLFYFKATIPRPGRYRVRFLLNAAEFYGTDDADYQTTLVVRRSSA
jgi:hypothetical protein